MSSRANTPARSKSKSPPKKKVPVKGKAVKTTKPAASKAVKKPSPSKAIKSKSVDQVVMDSESEDDGNDSAECIVYKKGSFIAFIDVNKDNDQRFDRFAVGKVSFNQ